MLTDISNVLKREYNEHQINSSPNISLANPVVEEKIPESHKLITQILDHWSTTTVMTFLTIYALFGDDLRLLATEKSSDDIFFSISSVCLFFFSIEIVLSCVVKDGYIWSFFFWLDVVATISLIPDIGWIWEPLLSSITGEDNSSSNDATDASQIARAGRASRAGTRAGRIIRILRVIRLIRIVKLYKLSQDARQLTRARLNKDLRRGNVEFRGTNHPIQSNNPHVSPPQVVSFEDISASQSFELDNHAALTVINTEKMAKEQQKYEAGVVDVPQESKVGRRLSELTTRRVIMLVLGMMFGLPLFYTSLYLDINTSYQYGLEILDFFIDTDAEFEEAWEEYVEGHKDLDTPLIYLEIQNRRTFETDVNPDDLRSVEVERVTLEDVEDDYLYNSLAIFDLRNNTRLEAGLNLGRTVFICIVLSISSILFSNDAQNLILGPIESMITKVKNIAKNPLKAAQEEEREEYTKQLILSENPDFVNNKKSSEKLETQFLENTLTKIGALLALGFGEAGSEVIATNMQSGAGDVNPMIPGRRVHCIFGFCDIRNFTDATEVLQQEVMRFVNEIGWVVHSTVDFFSGNANKNIGDAFLLVWKFPEECTRHECGEIVLNEDPFVNVLADMAVMSFVKIIAETNTSPMIVKYREHPALVNAMPGYSVKMGFGLHQGWAIEGAIGSDYKIDASYLSPNVNMASRLEAATKQFGVPILISNSMYEICSPMVQENLRMIDRVTVKGSTEPIELYTCDLEPEALTTKEVQVETEKTDLKQARIMARIRRDQLREDALMGVVDISDWFDEDEDIRAMRMGISKIFLQQFETGLQAYLSGDWPKALEVLKNAEKNKGKADGPSQTLIQFMEQLGEVAPDDWPGFRELTEK